MTVRCLRCGAPLDGSTIIHRPRVTDDMLDRAIVAYDRAAGDPYDDADHESAMREALAAALEVTP